MRRYVVARSYRVIPIGLSLGLSLGCTVPWTSEPKNEFQLKGEAVREILNAEDAPQLTHEIAGSSGFYVRIFESFGLVNGLAGTGGDCRPSPQRDFILNQMRADDVKDPNRVLASPYTALVQIQTVAAPGMQKDQRVDAIVQISKECEATSLQGGYLLSSRLYEHQKLGGILRQSAEKAKVEGPILHMPRGFVPKGEPRREKIDYTRGRILGGARLLDTRLIGLRIKNQVAHVMTSKAVTKSVNEHFFIFDGARRRGVATAKDDDTIVLDIPRKYLQDPQHFVDTVLHIGFREKSSEREARIELARKSLAEPTTARRAALQLETLGKPGIAALEGSLSNPNPEIQFYVAYSLAYLDQQSAVPTLKSLAIQYPEFRKLALVGLSVITHYDARDALEQLLQIEEPEIRYGAVDALRIRDDSMSALHSTRIGEAMFLVEVPSEIPLVAVSLQDRPEIAIFGSNPDLYMTGYLEVSPRLVMRQDELGGLRVTRFQSSGDDRVQVVPPNLKSALQAIEQVGGTYNDMVQFIDLASEKGILPAPIAFNPRPTTGRKHQRLNVPDMLDGELQEIEEAEPMEVNQDVTTESSEPAWWDVRRLWSKPDASKSETKPSE